MAKSKYLEISTVLLIFTLSIVMKTYRIENGDFVVWDEAHFGKFSEKYLSRKFYFDVHPPLGKILTSLGGYLFNQPLDFEFKSGEKFPKGFDYSGMRRFHSAIASFMPVLGYLMLKEMKYSYKRRILLSLIFIFENGFTSIGRLILLDSHLLTFTAAVAYFMTRMYFRSKEKIDLASISLLGITLGCVLSIKWIGFLTMSLVGLFTIYCLWCNITSKESILGFAKLFLMKAFFLICIPASLYVLLFYIHFEMVNRSSSDDGHMSSLFQATLKGSDIGNNRKYPLFGTKVTIKSSKTGGGYLHSHDHKYPNGENNQVTIYHHKDENNAWVLQKVTDDLEDAEFISSGDTVVLLHMETRKYLDIPGNHSLMSSGLRAESSGSHLSDTNLFKIEIVEDAIKKEGRVKTLTTKFRLFSTKHNCYLKPSSRKYPSWGFEQGEVICGAKKGEATLWNVEENTSAKLSEEKNPVYKEITRYPFSKKFVEHNKAMFITNASFIQDEDLEPERIVSKPYEWFILKRGLRMTAWDGQNEKFYMFGNPLVWYSSGICVILSPIVLLCRVISRKRKGKPLAFLRNEGYMVFLSCCGWLLHYIPFFFVKRVLYFHHYYPALFFALFSLCYIMKFARLGFVAVFTFFVIVFFFLYSRLTYGFGEETEFLRRISIIPTWDFIEKGQ
ncbi:dolichyl-phosphate-mannose-protein O-mannosyl transferase [Encephalitozoon intestinalis ATCC 50506]|uniref:Dolichyl-phosphate-mannose--protein mannosyltransferase n=1 Tax=Encephalitozoon intestinalis (strain ATCC 50506) TaxID=876142 RepID=E0S5Y8_ENCIT|nr:dolichyl-phosphate-mannose-protein O-mannosyl transferase [Encephalitozoon intestinalis ATCC 50506]ADM11123.1 dolichyl-phosphate-mannose-protein O-mannosyl transferase [Encephalitozoon intestinalis ATCC 50506]UTX44777.1 dolichyl-phosphate-mannose-protein O-mannosyl transferase [Encephalitozoon intestinalis]